MTTLLDAGANQARAVGVRRRRILRPLAQFLGALLLVASPLAARADGDPGQPAVLPPPTDPPKFEIIATPYLWLPWTHVLVRPNTFVLAPRSITIGPGQLISHLTWVPFMGEAEVRSGAYGVVFDYIHAPVTSGITTSGILFGSGSVGTAINEGTAMFLYRPLSTPGQYLDVGVGVRAWGIRTQVAFSEGLLPAVNLDRGAAWADALIGVRYHYNFGNGFGATAYGDVGGLGANVDWQLLGAVDYKSPGWPVLSAGFRSLNFNYPAHFAHYNVNMYGPYLSGSLRF